VHNGAKVAHSRGSWAVHSTRRVVDMMGNLFFGLVAGAVGLAYITYGKRQSKFVPLVAGVLLCAYPYFVDSGLWLAIIGALLVVAPFVIDF